MSNARSYRNTLPGTADNSFLQADQWTDIYFLYIRLGSKTNSNTTDIKDCHFPTGSMNILLSNHDKKSYIWIRSD